MSAPESPPGTAPLPPLGPVVGIGASAGGLDAVTRLMEALPPSPGMAFLVVMHLPVSGESHLPAILSRATVMPVVQATDGMRVEMDHVYVIPPGAVLTVADGHLALSPRRIATPHMPIDHLFRSLAETHKSQAIAVILSGDGTDGALAFKDIKAAGGITFAQDERTARNTSMPRGAVADGHVDYVLPPAEIARELVRLTGHPYETPPVAEALLEGEGDAIHRILALLRSRTDVDFHLYKRTTVRRRIQRRMALRGKVAASDYLAYLRDDAQEVMALFQDLLIRVTQYFRDPEAFEALKEKVFPLLMESRQAGAPIRIWVSGCATGEEAYSLAIVLLEYLSGRPERPPIKILATDLNDAALERARSGVFLDNIEIDVSPERLRKYFVRVDGSYQISKAVRELCVFSRHNMGSDPPFSHLDLISCRNVLIYMDAALQRRVLPILHYALNPNGVLFLGSSESIGPFTELFAPIDPRHRIFVKKPAALAGPLEFGPYVVTEGTPRHPARDDGAPMWNALDVQREADRIVLSRFAPVGVVIDEGMIVLQFRGRTGPYLEPASGMSSLDLLRMLREGLLAEVRAAIGQAKAEHIPVTRDGQRVADGGAPRPVRVEVIPFKVPPSGLRFFLVLFHDLDGAAGASLPAAAPERPPAAPDLQALQLQQELAALREYLQSVIEEQESTNEELKSVNEEILSANEELQSTNEELQTAKEEAQSANEELATVERELVAERAFTDTLLDAVPAAALVVGDTGRVLRCNPAAAAAAGRPAAELIGLDWAMLLPAEARPAAREAALKSLFGGSPWPFNAPLLRLSGTPRMLSWALRRVGPLGAEPRLALALGHDITELQEAQRRALEAERLATLGQVAATLAHEGRNLLQSAASCLTRLGWHIDADAGALDLLRRAETARHGLARLFDDVQRHAAPLRLELTECHLPDLWREAWEAARASDAGRPAALHEAGPADGPRVRADRFRLVQVFRNVLENAFAAVEGEVAVRVSCCEGVEGGAPGVCVSFRDNGPGFSPESRARVFDPFFTTKARGTGLGMSIAHRIIEAHGGRIAIGEAAPGAEIHIWLPRRPE